MLQHRLLVIVKRLGSPFLQDKMLHPDRTDEYLSGKRTTWDSNPPSHPGMDLDFPIHAHISDSETCRGQMMLWIQRCLRKTGFYYRLSACHFML